MQGNQWKTASEQLLKHWQRSGISQIPKTTPRSESNTSGWLTEHASVLYENAESSQETESVPSSTCNLDSSVKEASPVAKAAAAIAKPEPMQTEETSPADASKEWESNALPQTERSGFFNALVGQVVACRKCEDIVCKRQQTVFGAGALDARVVMFGEAPGAGEDRLGEPFVGAAGQLLDKILVASGLKRAEVYILNALKCRPPNNRTPTDAEIENCRPFFESQLETIRPEYIVCWGAVAVRAVLRSTESVGRLRGKFHVFRGAKVMVTYHPAYLLRNPDAKRHTWDDMKMLIKDMGLQIPGKSG